MLLRWPLCCCSVFVWLFFCSSPTFLLELDIYCLAWTMPCVLSCGFLPRNLGCWMSIGHSCCEGLPCLLVSVWLVLFLLLFLLLSGWLQASSWLAMWSAQLARSIGLLVVSVLSWIPWCVWLLVFRWVVCWTLVLPVLLLTWWVASHHTRRREQLVFACWCCACTPICSHALGYPRLLLSST